MLVDFDQAYEGPGSSRRIKPPNSLVKAHATALLKSDIQYS